MKEKYFEKILSYVFLFFIFAIIGYVWEVVVKLVDMGILVNTGTLYGPWVPIYGFGGIAVLVFFKRFKEKPLLVFLFSLVLCTSIEYFTSYFLEATKGLRWWDYSNYLININGRVCLEGAIIFGLAGCIIIYLAEPLFMKLFNRTKKLYITILCVFLSCLFITDVIYSNFHPNVGVGVTFTQEKT